MRIERLDPAVAALQLMARVPAPEPAVNQAKMAQNAGLDAERGSQNTYSNLLKARMTRLEKLKTITETAGKYAALVRRMGREETDEKVLSGVAETAAQSLVEMLMEANAEGPPVFPPLPSPLARSRKSLAGYLNQTPDAKAPPAGSEEAAAVESASALILGSEGILAALRTAGSQPLDDGLSDRLEDLAQQTILVTEQASVALNQMQAKTELRPHGFDQLALLG